MECLVCISGEVFFPAHQGILPSVMPGQLTLSAFVDIETLGEKQVPRTIKLTVLRQQNDPLEVAVIPLAYKLLILVQES